MNSSLQTETVERIQAALESARQVFARFTPGEIEAEYKAGHDPVTEADKAIDSLLRSELLREGEGWLSEETVDDLSRLGKKRVWIVDPLDGTREFVAGIPEFCVSVAMVENGIPVAGGICNPATNEIFFVGSLDSGVTYNGKPVQASQRTAIDGAAIFASRSEIKRGEWKRFENAPLKVKPMGSVAYKLALVAAGLADSNHLHAHSEKRMGHRRRRRPGNQRRWFHQHAGKFAVALQSEVVSALRSAGRRSVSAR